ncbi:hypothetical protein GCM10011375_00920 [Hymenobacter qilianensis]|uniref:DUF4394 domain-containing protein n=2 Tax=Hymenobacter qilianensis TaxID=1385715 RepID=A0A7H0GRN1_9BACT|nr:DUF4394 domain-containing protein [Hymenobacter qilianensis]QNP50947.1 DUF4394 domain-containing protein [Hymenobacter qilianensis]GGF49202.1 hypothetical protein GCM10011375_00920 [Hymenobacter qilianensis]
MKKTVYFKKLGMCLLLLASLTSCEDILEQYFPKPTPPPSFPNLGLDIPFYTLSGGTKLDAYSTKAPAVRTASVDITGLQGGERILAIDFRPASGQLYGVSSANRIYIINHLTGRAHAVGSGAFMPALEGSLVGFDFNPTVDRIRIVTSTGQNLRLNPETGAGTIVDGTINGAAGAIITASAYTNNVAGASATVLYDLDPATDKLYRQDPPNNGMLAVVGDLKLGISGDGGFDIDAKSGTALGLFDVAGKPTLFTVNLNTGDTQPLAQYSQSLGYSGVAIPTQPVAYAVLANYRNTNPIKFNDLVIFNPTNPTARVSKPITGLLTNEFIQGIDFRPANGQIYAITTNYRLVTINAATAAATFVGSLDVVFADFFLGFDFNPVTDEIRIVEGYTNANLRVNPLDATVTRDRGLNPNFNGFRPFVGAVAYDNNFVGATTTNLYVIDANSLYLQNPPNAGTLVEIGPLGMRAGRTDFDIGSTSNSAYAIMNRSGSSNITTGLYTINLSTGRATLVSDVSLFVPNSDRDISGFTMGLGF